MWLAYEKGSKTLSQRLCIIKSENTLGQRQYVIQHQSFYKVLLKDMAILADFIVKMG